MAKAMEIEESTTYRSGRAMTRVVRVASMDRIDPTAGETAVFRHYIGDHTYDLDRSPIECSKNAMEILTKRYLQKDPETGSLLETPIQMFERVAFKLALIDFVQALHSPGGGGGVTMDLALARANDHFKSYFVVLRDMLFIPAGRTLANKEFSIPNCVVLNIGDSMESIFETLKSAALLQKWGCGLGFPLHLMRPTGSRTVRSGGESSGPISFLHVYNTAFAVIQQQNRHGGVIHFFSFRLCRS